MQQQGVTEAADGSICHLEDCHGCSVVSALHWNLQHQSGWSFTSLTCKTPHVAYIEFRSGNTAGMVNSDMEMQIGVVQSHMETQVGW